MSASVILQALYRSRAHGAERRAQRLRTHADMVECERMRCSLLLEAEDAEDRAGVYWIKGHGWRQPKS